MEKQRFFIYLYNDAGKEELDMDFNGTVPEAMDKALEYFKEHFEGFEPEVSGRFIRCEKGFTKVFGPVPSELKVMHLKQS